MLGIVPPAAAALAMAFSSVSVVLNPLRVLRFAPRTSVPTQNDALPGPQPRPDRLVSSVNLTKGPTTMQELTLIAPDITCDHCKRTIEAEFATLAGVAQVQVEPPAKTVHVVYDEALVSEPAIRSRLDKIGYPVAV